MAEAADVLEDEQQSRADDAAGHGPKRDIINIILKDTPPSREEGGKHNGDGNANGREDTVPGYEKGAKLADLWVDINGYRKK